MNSDLKKQNIEELIQLILKLLNEKKIEKILTESENSL